MYHFTSNLFTYHIQAIDGEMGKIKDIYSDDDWKIRYVIADTRRWLPERKVLLPPAVFERIHPEDEIVKVSCDRSTIKNSPPVPENSNLIDDNENMAMRSFDWDWPNQVLITSELNTPGNPQKRSQEKGTPDTIQSVEEVFFNNEKDVKLRSHRDIIGARVHAKDGKLGKLLDFICTEDWDVKYIILTGNDFTTNDFYVYPIEMVINIDWYEADVYLDETMSNFETKPVYPNKEGILETLS